MIKICNFYNSEIKFSTHLILSLWALYSIVVPECKLRTLLKVSRILAVTGPSHAVLFQILRMSSWNLMDTTAPQISSPTMNCSPSRARTRFSQQRDAKPERRSGGHWDQERGERREDCNILPFLNRTIHLPPNLLASSSHMGLIPILNRWKSLWLARSPGLTRWL